MALGLIAAGLVEHLSRMGLFQSLVVVGSSFGVAQMVSLVVVVQSGPVAG